MLNSAPHSPEIPRPMLRFWKRKPAPEAAPSPPLEAAPPAATVAPPAVDEAPSPAERRTWRHRLAGNALGRAVVGLFATNPKLDEDLLEELETVLLSADVGVAATKVLLDDLRRRMHAREFADANAMLRALRTDLVAILKRVARPLDMSARSAPFVLMVVGVNGVGKTTTIGKLAQHLKNEGARVVLAAGDTFRAAAVDQLEVWGERNDVPVIAQHGDNADAAAVIFDALQTAKARGADVLIADTAGRLHTKTGLMDELRKIRRVLGKLDPEAPHEVLLVLDGTTGQNALSQVNIFHQAVLVTGIAVTKLDGTAKGGVVFALAQEYGIPIRYVGIGETLDDLRVFDPAAFVDGLLPESLGAA
jgi:fused signal recognition particle receptor